ncbi:MAG: hypothetical protein LBG27_11120 [Spirochaetaceae bacterium]|nr:hypothetical protein [Spirochaetaceae bacterium]
MRSKRELAKHIWCKVQTSVNISEPLFRLPMAVVLLHRVFREIRKRYPFEIRGFQLEGARLTFYIKPDDGFMLPLIMQLLKQTFSLRFNIIVGRKGHVWGERYESEILDGEPPEDAEEVDWGRQTSRPTRR